MLKNKQSFGSLKNLRHSRPNEALILVMPQLGSSFTASRAELHSFRLNRCALGDAMAVGLEHAGIAFFMVVVAGLATCLGASAVFFHSCATWRHFSRGTPCFWGHDGCRVVQFLEICCLVFHHFAKTCCGYWLCELADTIFNDVLANVFFTCC